MAKAWVVRSGRFGERDAWALAEGVSGGGWAELPDLTPLNTRDKVNDTVREEFAGATEGKLANYAGQVWALRGRIGKGDLLVMPRKATREIALGRVTSGYEYRAAESDLDRRHVVRVDWLRTDLPRSAVKQDLLFTLGSAMSIFAPSKNDAVARLEALLKTGVDPGQTIGRSMTGARHSDSDGTSSGDVDEPEIATDIEEVAYDQIMARIAEEFAGHGLATLVTELLEAVGFQCTASPPGPDGGVDIIGGTGALGLDAPRLLVQVKSGGQIGAPVVTQLHGVMSTHGADQGLLVAWGGLTRPAREALRNHQLRVRVWEAADVVAAVLRHFEQLSEEVRAKLPLKRVWMLTDAGL